MAKRNPLATVPKWRAGDQHTGIGRDDGIPYTYEHVEAAPKPGAAVYRIETYIPFEAPTPIHRNVHYVLASKLDEFFNGWGDYAETVIDVRPLTLEQALAELRQFRLEASSRPGA